MLSADQVMDRLELSSLMAMTFRVTVLEVVCASTYCEAGHTHL